MIHDTPELALLRGEAPLIIPRSSSGIDRVVYMRRMCLLAREYLVDYNLIHASARAGIPWELVSSAERDPVFITLVQQMSEELKVEEITTRAEVLNMLKREACSAEKSRDRIAAMRILANVAGFTAGEDGGPNSGGGAPIINITLNGGTTDRPVLNVTQQPHSLL